MIKFTTEDNKGVVIRQNIEILEKQKNHDLRCK